MKTTATREVERKYESDSAGPLPPLEGLPGVSGVGEAAVHQLEATYFDTPDLRLAARGIRLRRRTGGTDAGWHVKSPSPRGEGSFEVHRPLGRATRAVPAELVALVQAASRGAALKPALRITTRRSERPLLGDAGRVLALVAEDEVGVDSLAGAATAAGAWREAEVELVDGDAGLLDAVEERLRSAGWRRGAAASKVARALGAGLSPAWPATEGQPSRKSPAGAVVSGYLRDQVAAVLEHDPRVRRDEPDSVHKMRVATRRLRSALRTFGSLLDADTAADVGGELRWLAAVLGEVRDAEVLRERLHRDLDGLLPELVLGPVQARVRHSLDGRYDEARDRLLAELSGTRYFTLLDALDRLVLDPPITALADERAGKVLPRLVRRTWRRLERELDAAPDEQQPRERDLALHEARKAAKRLRYAGESVASVFGERALRLAARAEDLQELLGERQDGVVMGELLLELAAEAHRAREHTFTYGVLLAQERGRSAAAEQELADARARLSAKETVGWLS